MKSTTLLENVKRLTEEDLLEIKGVGEVLAKNIVDFTNSQRFNKLAEGFKNLEINEAAPEIIETVIKNGELSGVSVCITGSFEISRDLIKESLEAKGVKVVNTVSKNTSILLAGEKAGSKLEKAKKLGIKIETNYKNLI